MQMLKFIPSTASFTLAALALVSASSAEAEPIRTQGNVAKLYDSLPTTPVKFGVRLGQSRLDAESKAFLEKNDASDICGVAEMAGLCGLYGADTIRKVANYSHDASNAKRMVRGGIDPIKLELLEEGLRRNLSASVGSKGLNEAEFQKLMPSGETSGALVAKKPKAKWLVDFRCADHIQSGQTGWWYPFNTSKLTTCASVVDVRFSWWFLSVETGITAAHSTLWRRLGLGETGVWLPDGTERSVCASSKWHNMNSGPRCNTKDWISKVSAAGGIVFNQSPVSIANYGTAERLTVPIFNTSIIFQ
jgi:hypothetical protein